MNPQDLFNDIKAIKAQLDELSKRPAPATAEQLKQINSRAITLDAKGFAEYVLPDLQKGLPDTVAIARAADEATNRITQTADEAARTITQAAQGVPRQVRVTGDIYGFTTLYAAVAYGLILVLTFFGAWLVCDHYRKQAQKSVMYEQSLELVRERDYYYNQIQGYKRNNPKYERLFPAYDNKGFWDQFNKP